MLIILTFDRDFNSSYFPEATDEPSAAAQRAIGHSIARLCRDECASAGPRSVRVSKGHASPSHSRLDMDRADGDGGCQFILDPWEADQVGRAMESDSSAVDLQLDHAAAWSLVRTQASREGPPHHNDLDLYQRIGDRRIVHIRTRPHHACRRIWAVAHRRCAAIRAIKTGDLNRFSGAL